MVVKDHAVIQHLSNYAMAGSFAGMVTVGAVLWFDVSSIGTLFESNQHAALTSLFLGGSILKGGLLGLAAGFGTLGRKTREHQRTVARAPAVYPIPA